MDIEKQQLKIPKIFPVMLAGGSGTRLWPLSRKSYPKQFSKLILLYDLVRVSSPQKRINFGFCCLLIKSR